MPSVRKVRNSGRRLVLTLAASLAIATALVLLVLRLPALVEWWFVTAAWWLIWFVTIASLLYRGGPVRDDVRWKGPRSWFGRGADAATPSATEMRASKKDGLDWLAWLPDVGCGSAAELLGVIALVLVAVAAMSGGPSPSPQAGRRSTRRPWPWRSGSARSRSGDEVEAPMMRRHALTLLAALVAAGCAADPGLQLRVGAPASDPVTAGRFSTSVKALPLEPDDVEACFPANEGWMTMGFTCVPRAPGRLIVQLVEPNHRLYFAHWVFEVEPRAMNFVVGFLPPSASRVPPFQSRAKCIEIEGRIARVRGATIVDTSLHAEGPGEPELLVEGLFDNDSALPPPPTGWHDARSPFALYDGRVEAVAAWSWDGALVAMEEMDTYSSESRMTRTIFVDPDASVPTSGNPVIVVGLLFVTEDPQRLWLDP